MAETANLLLGFGLYIDFDRSLLQSNITIDDLDNIVSEYESIIGSPIERSCGSNEILETDLDRFYYKYIYEAKVN